MPVTSSPHYRPNVQAGIKFLHESAAALPASPDIWKDLSDSAMYQDVFDSWDEVDIASLKNCFEEPGENSWMALMAYTACVCEGQAGRPTPAFEIKEEFKAHFDVLKESSPKSVGTEECGGASSPCSHPDYCEYLEELKVPREYAGKGERTLPFSYSDLEDCIALIEQDLARLLPAGRTFRDLSGPERGEEYGLRLMRTYLPLAFYLYATHDEMRSIKQEDWSAIYTSDPPVAGASSIKLAARGRKRPTGSDSNGTYCVVDIPGEEACNNIMPLRRWNVYLNFFSSVKPEHGDYLFPDFNPATGEVDPSKKLSAVTLRGLFRKLVTRAKLISHHTGGTGRFTLNSLRKGGAQHFYNFSSKNLTLDALSWWGAWSKDERLWNIHEYARHDTAKIIEILGTMDSEDLKHPKYRDDPFPNQISSSNPHSHLSEYSLEKRRIYCDVVYKQKTCTTSISRFLETKDLVELNNAGEAMDSTKDTLTKLRKVLPLRMDKRGVAELEALERTNVDLIQMVEQLVGMLNVAAAALREGAVPT